MGLLAVIGGTGLDSLEELEVIGREVITTPYGDPSNALIRGRINNNELLFLPRHGSDHQTPPHLINYRANIWALKEKGVTGVIAFAAVGGITKSMTPGRLIIPDQLIDYTYGREHTFYDSKFTLDKHIEFTEPYDTNLRTLLLNSATEQKISCVNGACYGVTQGPRLETAAEIRRMERDGCDIVGMTALPEAALARELGLPYVNCAIVANWAAGKSEETITSDSIVKTLKSGMDEGLKLLKSLVRTTDLFEPALPI